MTRKRLMGSVAATALLSLLLAILTLPICTGMLACTMPCCEVSGAPETEDHAAMPASAGHDASHGCSSAFVQAADERAILAANSPTPQLPPAVTPRAFSDIARPAASAHAPRPHSGWPPACRIHVVNDVFLI